MWFMRGVNCGLKFIYKFSFWTSLRLFLSFSLVLSKNSLFPSNFLKLSYTFVIICKIPACTFTFMSFLLYISLKSYSELILLIPYESLHSLNSHLDFHLCFQSPERSTDLLMRFCLVKISFYFALLLKISIIYS